MQNTSVGERSMRCSLDHLRAQALKLNRSRDISPALAGAVALAKRVVAIARFSQSAIRTDTRLRVHAPEQPIVRRRHGGIRLGVDEQAFPTKGGAPVTVACVEAFAFGYRDHAAPPLAARTSGTA